MLENGMVIAAAACNYGYGWDDDYKELPDIYCADAYFDEEYFDDVEPIKADF